MNSNYEWEYDVWKRLKKLEKYYDETNKKTR
jgi:hypothetical protein